MLVPWETSNIFKIYNVYRHACLWSFLLITHPFHVWCSQKLLIYKRVHLSGLPVSGSIPDHQWSPWPGQVTRLISHLNNVLFLTSQTEKILLCPIYVDKRCNHIGNTSSIDIRLPGIDSLKCIIMQIFYRNIPDVNLSHLKIDWIFRIT